MQKEYKWRKRTNEDSSKTPKQETTILQRYDSIDQQQSWSYFKISGTKYDKTRD